MIKLGQVYKHERGECFIAALNQHPYYGDHLPYIYVVAMDGSWSDYVKYTDVDPKHYQRKVKVIQRVREYCPDCGNHYNEHTWIPASVTEPGDYNCPSRPRAERHNPDRYDDISF
jgi:hypothetical protein